MKKRKVISPNHLPTKIPLIAGLVLWLALDHWNAPEWVYWVVASIIGLISVLSVYRLITDKYINVTDEDIEETLNKDDVKP